ncbi:MAG: ABC transporter substrate-binding protein [Armatimonadota bacterium]
MRRFQILKLCAIAIILVTIQTAACATKYPLAVKDCRGKTVTFPKEPARIVSLTPNNTELLYAIGAGSKLVAATSWSDYPEAAKKLPKIGDRTISIEKVVALKPELVLAHGNLNDDAVRSLESHKVKVFVIDPKSINEVAGDIRMIGKIVNRESKAQYEAKRLIQTKEKIKKLYAKSGSKPKVLVCVQADPLWAAGPKTFVDEMIKIAGGINLTGDAKPGFNQFSTEAAVSRNPDVIIGTAKGDRKIFTNGQWKITKAAKKGRIYEANPDILVRPGPRLVDGMYKIAGLVHSNANIKK